MKVKMLLVAAALLALAAAGFGQPMQYSLNNVGADIDPSYNGRLLTTTCDGNVGIPDGTPILIYQDANSNGPDAADQMATLCAAPPDCGTGPAGTFNFNQQPMNGGEQFGVPGYFVGTAYFTSSGAMPAGAARFYCVVLYGGVKWTSEVMTAAIGGSGDWFFNTWTCETVVQPCVPTPDMTVPQIPVDAPDPTYCDIHICPDHVFTFCVGPIGRPDHIPGAHVVACPGGTLPAGLVASFNGFVGWTWTVTPNGNFYCGTVTSPVEACICVVYDHQLDVEVSAFSAVGNDNSAKISWTTASESNVARFEVRRDGNVVATKTTDNPANGASYSYTDNSVVNGTTYSYELVSVNTNGNVTVLRTASVTPSFNNAEVTEYALHQNFPNPFNPTTEIAFDVVNTNPVTLTVFNAQGQEVTKLMSNKSMTKGRHLVSFDATNLPSGLYFYSVKIGNEFSATKKMLLVK